MSKHPVEDSNSSDNTSIQTIFEKRVSRRSLLASGISMTLAGSFLGSVVLTGCSDDNNNNNGNNSNGASGGDVAPTALGFAAVGKSLADRVVLPTGYSARVLFALGDPIVEGLSEYANDGSDDGNWDRRSGDHHDAMAFFPLPKGSSTADRGLLAINHEELTEVYLHENGPTPVNADGVRPLAEVLKEQWAIGVSIIEVRKVSGQWTVDRSSSFNKRWHVNSQMEMTGPARGSSLLTTPLSSTGSVSFGTINNCGHGLTPWGTYLTGEENFFAYFTLDATEDETSELLRYGIRSGTRLFNYKDWDRAAGATGLQRRFNASQSGANASEDFRNEPNHFGYVVEIDPYNPDATPKKRSALGRCSHEGAWFAPVVAGQPLVCYTGDDARNEYIYKFVSAANWDAADASGGLEIGDKYLDEGTLYAAKFNDDGTGDWVPLTTDNPDLGGMTADEIVIFSRIAADRAGATKMDRPEWGGVNPINSEVYFALTNSRSSSSGRGQGGDGSLPRDAANPRSYDPSGDPAVAGGNVNGHIIRWREDSATRFTWDIYAFGARSAYSDPQVNISNLDDSNDFSSPDGLWFDKRGMLWIQTDDGAYTDVTNTMMLAALPGTVGDGAEVAVGGEDGLTVTTFAGASPGDKMRRFLVGVPGCEITGVDLTPDNRSMFLNVQHPGERGNLENLQSSWPNPNGDALALAVPGDRPRTATIVITRDDGGEIGV